MRQMVQFVLQVGGIEMKPALVIIDMQRWFFRSEERRVKLPELITSINELIDVANEENIPIFIVLTIHKNDRSTWNIVMKKHNFYNEPRKQDIQNGQNKLECSYG